MRIQKSRVRIQLSEVMSQKSEVESQETGIKVADGRMRRIEDDGASCLFRTHKIIGLPF